MQKSEGAVIPMKNINYLLGNSNIENKPLEIYSFDACNFLSELSSDILKSSVSRAYPDLTSVAFWCRKANIQKKKEQFGALQNRLGRGLCFHIAPSNIPINFIFSYFFGLLAGNSNIVRLPSKEFAQVDVLIEIIKKIITKYPEIEKRTAFIKYDRNNNEITEKISKISDCRMIWGGDKTIAEIRSMQVKPRCIDMAFADRYSVCIIDGEKIIESDERTINRLAENFYNDTYLMDQNACSSPQMIYWLNNNEKAHEKFWESVLKTAKNKYVLQDAVAVDKYTKLCEDAINNNNIIKSVEKFENILYINKLNYINENVKNLRGKGGYFYEYSLNNFEEFLNIVDEKYQTVTYFGIDCELLVKDIIKYNIKGIDRIVPIGKAMDIDDIWDGYDIIRFLSRNISVI